VNPKLSVRDQRTASRMEAHMPGIMETDGYVLERTEAASSTAK
jgi:hypothetical protein